MSLTDKALVTAAAALAVPLQAEAAEGPLSLVVMLEIQSHGEPIKDNKKSNFLRALKIHVLSYSVSDREVVGKLRTDMLQNAAASLLPALILPTDTLPRTDSGKINRKELYQQFFEHLQDISSHRILHQSHYAAVYDTYPENALSQILRVLGAVLPVVLDQSEVSKKTFYDVGGDSMLGIEFVWKLKEEIGLVLQVKDLRLTFEEIVFLLCAVSDTTVSKRLKSEIRTPQSASQLSTLQTAKYTFDRTENLPLEFISSVRSPIYRNYETSSCEVSEVPNIDITWEINLEKCIDASPIVAVLKSADALHEIELIYVGSHGGDFICVKRDGSVVWKARFGAYQHVEASAAIGLHDSIPIVIVASFSGSDVDGPRSEDLVSVDTNDGEVWAVNALSGELIWHRTVHGEVYSSLYMIYLCAELI